MLYITHVKSRQELKHRPRQLTLRPVQVPPTTPR